MALFDSLAGHLWTVAPVLRARIRASPLPHGRRFAARVHDPDLGEVRVTGLLSLAREGAPLLVLVHGLGGSFASPYMVRLGRLAQSLGANTLLLNLRGADREGDDIYHAGLSADLSAALASPDLLGVESIAVLGCSVGGHMVLRWALAPSDARVRAVAALCSPLDLHQGCRDIDDPVRAMYRDHALHGLKEIYLRAHARGRGRTPLAQVQRVRTIRAWDELVVAPRFGFQSAEHYWHETQVAPHLCKLALPSRIVLAKSDPMVLGRPLRKYLVHLPNHVQAHWVEGGHLGFPPSSRVEVELVQWLLARAREGFR